MACRWMGVGSVQPMPASETSSLGGQPCGSRRDRQQAHDRHMTST